MPDRSLVWREVFWPRPLVPDDAVRRLKALATDPRWPLVVLEARASRGTVRHLVGAEPPALNDVLSLLNASNAPLSQPRLPVMTARRLTLQPRLGLLDVSKPDTVAAGLLAALSGANRDGEEVVVQMVLGPRLAPTTPPAIAPESSWARLIVSSSAAVISLDAKTVTQKTSTAGFQAVVRLGVTAGTAPRRRALALGALGALHLMQTPSSRLGLVPEHPERLGAAQVVAVPRWRWPLRLNATEAVSLAALPVSKTDDDLPGLPAAHPRLLPPPVPSSAKEAEIDRIVVARATAPGAAGTLTRSTAAVLRHTHVVGPTGTGKSVLLLNLTLQDINAGRGAVVIEPKGDLVDDLLARIPEHRMADVVVLDPLADHVVGLNPLSGSGSPELCAGAVLSVFTGLFGDALGPRTTDVLHSCLLTLSRQPDASLVQIPRLLTDPAFRASKVASVSGDMALGSFWTWYEALREAERASVIAPLMNKLRAVILRPSIRRVIGQSQPLFHVSQVFGESKILPHWGRTARACLARCWCRRCGTPCGRAPWSSPNSAPRCRSWSMSARPSCRSRPICPTRWPRRGPTGRAGRWRTSTSPN